MFPKAPLKKNGSSEIRGMFGQVTLGGEGLDPNPFISCPFVSNLQRGDIQSVIMFGDL